MKWTKAYRKTHGKELMYDSTLDFEKRREEPVRYNRDLYVKTVQAIGKIEQIKAAREKRFKNARIKEAKRPNSKKSLFQTRMTSPRRRNQTTTVTWRKKIW